MTGDAVKACLERTYKENPRATETLAVDSIEADGQTVAVEFVERAEGDAGELRASLRVVEEFVPSAGHEIGRHGEFRREGFSERHCLFPLLTVGIAWSLHKPIVGRLPHGLLVSCVF